MKLITSLFLLALSTGAYAGNINLDMQDVTLSELSQAVIKGILQKDFSISPETGLDAKRVTVQLKNQDPENVLKYLNATLNANGAYLNQRDGILYIENQQQSPGQVQTYPMNNQSTAQPNIAAIPNQEFYIYRSQHRPLTDFPAFFQSSMGAAGGGQASSVTVDGDIALIRGSRHHIDMARYVLSQYDRPSNEIEIKASIVEFASTDNDAVGVFGAMKVLSNKLNVNIGTKNPLRDFATFGSLTFDLVLSSAATDSRFNILESSTIRVVSGKTGRINVGQEVPVLGQFTTDQTGRAIQSISYRSSGLIVDIKPMVVADTVHAEIQQQLSSFAVTSTSSIDSPTLLKREINTSLTAPFNEVVFIGGLDEQRDTKAKSTFFGIPINKNDTAAKSTLFLLLEFKRR